ncbi:hypothetical protein D8I35_00920 [Corticibacter populi]|uniref:Copper resistance protein D domain-containing protein n=1 Tax=Corticibacter populi TaxID=1550736 RepID=A0A3M6QXY5_9BURK|nr:CopD family protein [Corticibacter populi]RMX07733.1 hypothetical protein D8I35_00920 [Corticibacter populi]RZS34951.1 putative copper export protein [Corticibacter populi]
MPWSFSDLAPPLLLLGRGLDLIASLQIFGALLFALWIARPWQLPDTTGTTDSASASAGFVHTAFGQWTRRLLLVALCLQLLAVLVWLPAQAMTMTEQAGLPALWLVASETQFGQALLGRTGLSLAAVWLAVSSWPQGSDSQQSTLSQQRLLPAALLAATAVALQARLGHAAALEDRALAWLVALHVLAAGAWLGGLLPLRQWLRLASPSAARLAVTRFSWLGLLAVATLALTAWWQSERLIGNPLTQLGGWLGTRYGQLALLKILGFALLLAFAAFHRLVLTPRLPHTGASALRRSIGWETVAGLPVLLLAVLLASQPPALHLQPQWPLPWQPDPRAWEKPWIRTEVWRGLVLAGVLLLGLASLLWRRTRVAGPLLAALLLLWLPAPNLRHFVLPAHPGSFYRSETGYTAAAIVRGEELLQRHCTEACARSEDNPADLSVYNIWQRSDGDLFDWLTRVFDRIGHSPFAHGTIATLDARQRWQLIDYFRARVSGHIVQGTQRWPYAVPPPALAIDCPHRPERSLTQLRGHFVYLLADPGSAAAPASGWLPAAVDDMAVVTVRVGRLPSIGENPAVDCTAHGPDAWQALAIAGGRPLGQLAGTGFLIDPDGWLRLQIVPEDAPPSATDWRRELEVIASTPQPGRAAAGHRH